MTSPVRVRHWALAVLLLAGCGEKEVVLGPPLDRDASSDARAAAELPRGRGHILARVKETVLVHDRPGGRPVARLRPLTPFGEPRTLGVFATRREGRWLGIHSPVLANDQLGWIENDAAALDLGRTRASLHVSLDDTSIELRRGRHTVRRIPIAIGRAGTSTPAGEFQVTDKLPGSRFPRAPYGCCILALSAEQPNLPPDWRGGNRIAIHGTSRPDTIGQASSNGCLRASDADLRFLMRAVPVGAPVFITA